MIEDSTRRSFRSVRAETGDESHQVGGFTTTIVIILGDWARGLLYSGNFFIKLCQEAHAHTLLCLTNVLPCFVSVGISFRETNSRVRSN